MLTLDIDTDQSDLQMRMLRPCVHSVHLHKPEGYVVKQEQLPQLLGHKPLQDPQVNGAGVTAAKVAREESERVTGKTLSKRSVTSSPVPGSQEFQDGC